MPDPEDADRERGYYTRLEHVQVDLVPVKEGWFLTKYKVESDVRFLQLRKLIIRNAQVHR